MAAMKRGKARPGRVLALKNGTTIQLTGDDRLDYEPTGSPTATLILEGATRAIRWCAECNTDRACKHVPN